MLSVELTGSQKVGYIVAIGYYFFETSTKGGFNDAFQVFGYVQGNYHSKENVVLLCIVLVIVQLLSIKRRMV